MDNKKYYFCYSYALRDYLKKWGVNPIDAGVHKGTKNTYWVYIMNQELSELLTKWSEQKVSC